MIAPNAWWQNLQNYNEAVFPAQIILYVLALTVVVVFLTQPEKTANRIIKAFFVLAFGWIGIIFFAIKGQSLPAFQAQTFLFVTLSILFTFDLLTETTMFKLPSRKGHRAATILGLVLVMAGYPILSLLLSRPLIRWIVPGSFPCPTTALALVFMSTRLTQKRRWFYFLTLFFLLLWALPFPVLIQIPQFGVYEDGIMLATGMYSLIMLIINWKKKPF